MKFPLSLAKREKEKLDKQSNICNGVSYFWAPPADRRKHQIEKIKMLKKKGKTLSLFLTTFQIEENWTKHE